MIDVKAVSAVDWPYVCLLKVTYPGRAGWLTIGSGTLISPVLVLTAGHVVYRADYGWPTSVVARFRADPTTEQTAQTVRTTTQWQTIDSAGGGNPESAYDFGVVVLQQAVDMTLNIRPLPVETASTAGLLGMTLSVLGYPIDPPPPGTLYGASARPSGVTATRLHYGINTIDGMSGGPVYDYNSATGTRTIRGVHTSPGSGLRITEDVLSLILAWKSEFRP